MIRRVILFLGLLFVGFFVYRRYDRPAADIFLYKIQNLSFSNPTTTISIEDMNQSGQMILSDSSGSLVDKIVDTLVDKTGSSRGLSTSGTQTDEIISQILTKDNLEQGITLPGLTGTVKVQTGPIETLSIPIKSSKSIQTTQSPQGISPTPGVSATLSDHELKEIEKFSQMFSH